MAINREKSDRIDLVSPKPLTRKIELYQSIKKYKTRNKAVRALVELGLEAECEKSPQLKDTIQKHMEQQPED